MDLIFLVGTLLAAIILVVVLIMRLHLHAFVSLVIACFFVGFVTGMPLLQICKSIEAGMGSTLGFLANEYNKKYSKIYNYCFICTYFKGVVYS